MEQSDARTTFSRQDPEESRVFLGLGSNLEDRFDHVAEALNRIETRGVSVCTCSLLYETEPVELVNQPDFINLACEVRTVLKPGQLLEACHGVEAEMGRVRLESKGPRVIDIDILFYGKQVLCSRRLSIPHPAITQRRFVLIPMVEIAAEFQHPVSGLSMTELLKRCADQSAVRPLGPQPDTTHI